MEMHGRIGEIMTWHEIHDFVMGWGYREDATNKVVYFHDIRRIFGAIHLNQDNAEVFYDLVQPFLQREREEWMKTKQNREVNLGTFITPLINRPYPDLPDLRSLFSGPSMFREIKQQIHDAGIRPEGFQ